MHGKGRIAGFLVISLFKFFGVTSWESHAHMYSITRVQLKVIENQLLRNLTLLANRLEVSK